MLDDLKDCVSPNIVDSIKNGTSTEKGRALAIEQFFDAIRDMVWRRIKRRNQEQSDPAQPHD